MSDSDYSVGTTGLTSSLVAGQSMETPLPLAMGRDEVERMYGVIDQVREKHREDIAIMNNRQKIMRTLQNTQFQPTKVVSARDSTLL